VIELHCRPPHEEPTRVVIGNGALQQLALDTKGRSVFALVDASVAELRPSLLPKDWTVLHAQAGESLKSLGQAELILRAMAAAGIDRKGLLLAIGGGTIGDVGGLCAALYLRGIECWQAPTTMMAMVDSAIGGKTAVNLPEGKNLVGAVHPPSRVYVDPTMLDGLPNVEMSSGIAEAIKMGIGLDASLFAILEREHAAVIAREPSVIERVIHRSLAAKCAVVESDLREDGPRRLLNLGHTLGHAIEALADGQIPHGLCVARGLHFALDVSESLSAMRSEDAERCRKVLLRHGHQRSALPPVEQLMPFVARDKKAEQGSVHFVLPTGIGQSRVERLRLDQLRALLAAG
jgi:3-dehydroquinate synthase